MSNILSKLVAGGFGVILIVAVLCVALIIPVIILKVGWALFMVPVLGFAPLTWGQAIGAALLISFTTSFLSYKSKSK